MILLLLLSGRIQLLLLLLLLPWRLPLPLLLLPVFFALAGAGR